MKRTHLPIITALSLTGSLMTSSAYAQSSLMQNNYPPMNTSVQLESSNLPLVWITTTGMLSRTERSLGHMKVINNADGVNYSDTDAYPDQTIEFDGPIAIKWRGSSSFGNDNTQTKRQRVSHHGKCRWEPSHRYSRNHSHDNARLLSWLIPVVWTSCSDKV